MTMFKTTPSEPIGNKLTRRSFFFGVAAAAVAIKLPPVVTVIEEAGFAVPVNEHLIRSQIWSKMFKEALYDDLISMKFVRTIEDG